VTRAPDPELLARALTRALTAPVHAEHPRRLSGGASRETWAFDATDGDGRVHELVLRRDPTAAGAGDRTTEYALLRAVASAGVAVPRVVALLDDADGLGAGFVMERVAGETIPRRILRDAAHAAARARLATQCGEAAARIHGVEVATLPRLPVLDAGAQLDQQRALLDAFGEPHPAFELGLRCLAERLPPEPERPRLVHGDFRHGNLVVGPDGLAAVLDWELAHLGDPVEDLGWCCVRSWRFGVTERVVGGFGDLDAMLDAYAGVAGARPDREHVRFWLALGTLKWGVICIAQAFTHLHGVVRSVELATLGRRVAETEWDLLDVLEGGW
jgi:aminoglycoside phosphotransferase (APT) family kinase protein